MSSTIQLWFWEITDTHPEQAQPGNPGLNLTGTLHRSASGAADPSGCFQKNSEAYFRLRRKSLLADNAPEPTGPGTETQTSSEG